MANRVHRPHKVVAFNANGISKQRYEISKQLQDLHIDVALFSETHLKPYERFYIPNYHFMESIVTREEKVELPFQSEKASLTSM
jgi:inorganic pyrophosphatase